MGTRHIYGTHVGKKPLCIRYYLKAKKIPETTCEMLNESGAVVRVSGEPFTAFMVGTGLKGCRVMRCLGTVCILCWEEESGGQGCSLI